MPRVARRPMEKRLFGMQTTLCRTLPYGTRMWRQLCGERQAAINALPWNRLVTRQPFVSRVLRSQPRFPVRRTPLLLTPFNRSTMLLVGTISIPGLALTGCILLCSGWIKNLPKAWQSVALGPRVLPTLIPQHPMNRLTISPASYFVCPSVF